MDMAADNLLRDAIAAIDLGGGASVRSFPVRDAGAEAMMVAHVIPIRLSAFVRCAAALILTPVTLPQAPPVELVQSLFDLTPSEARVARSLAAGETVEAIASARGVSQNTIRAHVRGVLEKTGCNRQTDVVALLTAIAATRLTSLPNGASFQKIEKISRALSILIRRQPQWSISVIFVRYCGGGRSPLCNHKYHMSRPEKGRGEGGYHV
jgi:DNA-binding CsgD family transcriptional regulator